VTLVRLKNRDDYVAESTGRKLPSRNMEQTIWMPPLESAVLQTNEVHVWKASLDVVTSRVAALRDVLSPEEHSRSRNYRFQDDRRRFVVARALLKTILGRYLRANPKELCFAISETGKPELHPCLQAGIRFSLSHCGDYALFAFAQDSDVGVDIEQVCADYPVDSVAQLFFTDQEQARFTSLPDCLRDRAFFVCWCRKEAIVKALGYGLPLGLARIEASMAPDEPAQLFSTRDQAIETRKWSLVDLPVGDGYEAAVAIKNPVPILKCWDASGI
jgi:4'-phosphopantetheinyl transferase